METDLELSVLEAKYVLIVPCGMETGYGTSGTRGRSVLIVPCGMETVTTYTTLTAHAMY